MKYKLYRWRQVVYCANEKQRDAEMEKDFDYCTTYELKEEYILRKTLEHTNQNDRKTCKTL